MASPVERVSTKRRKVRAIPGSMGGPLQSAGAGGEFLQTAGGSPAGLSADVTDELAQAAPTFGNLLRSIGTAVVASQQALDKGVVDTVNSMADTTIEVATTVIQHLDDDGLPNAEATEVITQELSLLNYAMPTVHQWGHVALSMDLEAAQVDSKSGLTFKQAGGSLGFGAGGGAGWGASLSLMFGSTSIDSRSEASWAKSQIMLDAQLSPRRTTKLPDPVKMRKGPIIIINAERKDDADMTKSDALRRLEVTITLLKATGEKHAGKTLLVDAGVFGPRGGLTEPDGKLPLITLERKAPLPEGKFSITVTFGEMSREIVVTL
jgi:hypothetical protein